MKSRIFLLVILSLLLTCCACGKEEQRTIVFSGDKITVNGDGVSVKDSTVTITASGTYYLSGTLADGQIVVNVTNGKAVYLCLQGADITCSYSSPILVEEASMVVLQLEADTQNIITDNHTYDATASDSTGGADGDLFTESPDSAIYSRSPLMIEGEGKLVVGGNCYNGICSNDTLTIESGNITVKAAHHGIKGRDYVVITGGNVSIASSNDGLKATNLDSEHMGYVSISGGNVTINAGDEGIYAPNAINISGGNVTLDSKNAGLKTEGNISLSGGSIDITAGDEPLLCAGQTIGDDALVTANGKPLTQ